MNREVVHVDLETMQGRIASLRKKIAAETDCAKAVDLVAMADTIEDTMARAGYRGQTEAIRPANEARFEARWKLGTLLAKEERQERKRTAEGTYVPGRDTGFRAYLRDIGLNKNRAVEAQRIAAIPKEKLAAAFTEAANEGQLHTVRSMFKWANPFWKMKERARKHRAIKDAADATRSTSEPESLGPFALIYADPPTEFETYGDGAHRSASQHYPVLSWEEIENFTILGKRVADVAHKDAIVFLWCTSSNLHCGLDVMWAWGFEFKASAVWDKELQGTGLIFRNQHEVLLYGSRGKVPGPVYVPSSVFRYRRRGHSAKPPEIRAVIERMYPDYDESTRLELFSRDGGIAGWTHFGFEAKGAGHASA